jgi:hypothetical protein
LSSPTGGIILYSQIVVNLKIFLAILKLISYTLDNLAEESMPNLAGFKDKLEENIHSNLTAKELAERIVLAALECEYGKNFTLTPGFAKMVNTLADSIVTNPDLRRQALAIASHYINKNRGNQKSITKSA